MKLFFSDLDGTLLNDQKNITAKTRQALQAWTEAGHKLILCSGRPLPSIRSVKESLLRDYQGMYLIAFNGGLIYDCDTDRILYRASLTLPQTCLILRTAEERGIHCHTYGDECILTPSENIHLSFYRKTIHMPCHVVPQLADALENSPDELLTDYPDIGSMPASGPCKCLAIESLHPERLELLRSRLQQSAAGPELNLLYSNPNLLEIFPARSGKGASVLKLCELLGVDIRDTVAAGDQANDLSMLQAAEISIAMQNALEDVKKAATIVTASDNNHDGLAEPLTRLA